MGSTNYRPGFSRSRLRSSAVLINSTSLLTSSVVLYRTNGSKRASGLSRKLRHRSRPRTICLYPSRRYYPALLSELWSTALYLSGTVVASTLVTVYWPIRFQAYRLHHCCHHCCAQHSHKPTLIWSLRHRHLTWLFLGFRHCTLFITPPQTCTAWLSWPHL